MDGNEEGKRDDRTSYTYHLVLQYDKNDGNDSRKFRVDDHIGKVNCLKGYGKVKEVMVNVNPEWFQDGKCVDRDRIISKKGMIDEV